MHSEKAISVNCLSEIQCDTVIMLTFLL